MQALEEENIELLKENKELRVQVSRLKASAGTGQSSSAAFPSESECNSVGNTPARADSLSACISGQKRAFGTEISNTVPRSAVRLPPVRREAAPWATLVRTKVGAKAVKATAQVADEGAGCKQS